LFDKELREEVEDIVVGGGPFFGDLQWRLASLPIRFGGLSLYSTLEASSYAFVPSRAQSWGATRSYFERQWVMWHGFGF
jgi:hypothetical protein